MTALAIHVQITPKMTDDDARPGSAWLRSTGAPSCSRRPPRRGPRLCCASATSLHPSTPRIAAKLFAGRPPRTENCLRAGVTKIRLRPRTTGTVWRSISYRPDVVRSVRQPTQQPKPSMSAELLGASGDGFGSELAVGEPAGEFVQAEVVAEGVAAESGQGVAARLAGVRHHHPHRVPNPEPMIRRR